LIRVNRPSATRCKSRWSVGRARSCTRFWCVVVCNKIPVIAAGMCARIIRRRQARNRKGQGAERRSCHRLAPDRRGRQPVRHSNARPIAPLSGKGSISGQRSVPVKTRACVSGKSVRELAYENRLCPRHRPMTRIPTWSLPP
jgi:hypothetical protein